MSDELATAFERTLGSKILVDTSSKHPRFCEYKSKILRSGEQECRRKDVLERQKRERFNTANYARKLAEGVLEEEEVEDVLMEEEREERRQKKFNPYRNQLMLSEWLTDKPEDLESNWLMVACPVGKRVLVVAHRGHTSAYAKNGYRLNQFPSLLPGGSFKTWQNNHKFVRSFTLLDCIYDEVNRTYWMLDLMCYQGIPMYDSDTDFRFFWLNTKLLEDTPSLNKKSSINPFKFIPCPHSRCLNGDFLYGDFPFKVDGLLFYHRLAHYRPGRNPLVNWLKPSMLPGLLGIPLPHSFTDSAEVVYDRDTLHEANKKLQNTISDKSFNNRPKDLMEG